MNNEFEKYKRIFYYLLEADKNIWEAVLEVEDCEVQELKQLIPLLMNTRGDIHTELMRPLYKKYPKLAKDAGFDCK